MMRERGAKCFWGRYKLRKMYEPAASCLFQEVSKSEAKHYVILFRDAGCQFRAIYEYYPEREDIFKLTGNGPKQLHNKMMDRFYKYV